MKKAGGPRGFAIAGRRAAITLKKMARERLTQDRSKPKFFPTWNMNGPFPGIQPYSMRVFIGVAKERIPAARLVTDTDVCINDDGTQTTSSPLQRVLMGNGLVIFHRRDLYPFDQESWQEAQDDVDHVTTTPYRDGDCEFIEQRCFNLCGHAIKKAAEDGEVDEAAPVLVVVQDFQGDFYIVRECYPSQSSSSSLSSTSQSSSAQSSSGSGGSGSQDLSSSGGDTEGRCPFLDTFTDSNGTDLTAHTADTGESWTGTMGTWEIQSNKASSTASSTYEVTDIGDNQDGGIWTVDGITAGTGDGQFQFDFREGANDRLRIIIRWQNDSLRFQELVGGSGTANDQTYNTVGLSTGSTYKIVVTMDGTDVVMEVYEDGSLLQSHTFTEAALSVNTGNGFRFRNVGETGPLRVDSAEFCRYEASSGSGISSSSSFASASSASQGSSSEPCYLTSIDGVSLDDLPIASPGSVAYVPAISNDGCLVRVPVSTCPTGSSGSGSG